VHWSSISNFKTNMYMYIFFLIFDLSKLFFQFMLFFLSILQNVRNINVSGYWLVTSLSRILVKIQVRISSQHPLACNEATRWGSSSDETRKNRDPVSQQVWHGKDPCSKTLSAEHGPKFCSPSPAMMTSSYEWKILEWDRER
jgi:hypothetical protein